jgi:small-conductance mechanosensitive channel
MSNIIPFPVPNRRDPSLMFFARYVNIERQISDANTTDERRSRLKAMLDEIDGVMARQVRS